MGFGAAYTYVFYPEVIPERCTVALLLKIDPIAVVCGRKAGTSGTLEAYVNNRLYVMSSFLSIRAH